MRNAARHSKAQEGGAIQRRRGPRKQHNKLKTLASFLLFFISFLFFHSRLPEQNVLPLKYEKLLNNSGWPGAMLKQQRQQRKQSRSYGC